MKKKNSQGLFIYRKNVLTYPKSIAGQIEITEILNRKSTNETANYRKERGIV